MHNHKKRYLIENHLIILLKQPHGRRKFILNSNISENISIAFWVKKIEIRNLMIYPIDKHISCNN